MRRPRGSWGRRAPAVVGLVVGAFLMVFGAPVGAVDAASIDDVGWWARTNQAPGLGAVVAPPDVPAGQLLVEGTAEGATAIAALRATLPEGTGSPILTLTAASEVSGETALLLACQSGSGWTGAHAGEWASKPSPDCSQSVQGIRADDGSSWTFPLGALQFGDQIDVVLTPGVDPAVPAPLNGSAFRIAFEQPSAASIEVSDTSFDVPTVDIAPPVGAAGAEAECAISGAG